MPISYKNKIYTTLGTPTALSGDVVSATNSAGVPAKDYTVKGKTIVWNQLFDKNSIPNRNSTAITYSVDGNINILSTTNVITTSSFNFLCPTVSDHKYMICAKSLEWNSPNHSNLFVGDSGNPDTASYATLTPNDLTKFFTATNETCYIKAYISYSAGNYEFKMNALQLFDLTQMFGTGNEPTTPAQFRAMFPDDYYSYNAGELKTIEPTSVEASTANLLNLGGRKEISTEVVGDRASTVAYPEIDTYVYYKGVSPNGYLKAGAVVEATVLSSSIIAKTAENLGASGYGVGIPLTVVPSTTYYIKYTASASGVVSIGYLNSSKNFIDYSWTISDNQFTTPVNCRYVLLVFRPDTYGASATFENICVSAVQTNEYQPYNKHRVNIPSSKYFPDRMRSAGSAYDEINFLSQKAIKRIGVVDMGTLNWSYEPVSSHERFLASVDGIKIVSESAKGNLVCPKYATASIDDVYLHTADKTIAVHYELEQIWVYDSSYTDPSALKAAMSGVMLYYELATPVETAITPSLQALSTYKGFTSFSSPNSLTQNGPLSVTYYAEGGNNPESGWLTSYKRKLYMGKNIEWNQLFTNSRTVGGTLTFQNQNGIITINGTSGTYYFNFDDLSDAMNQTHSYLFYLKILNNPDNISLYYGWLNRGYMRTDAISAGETCRIIAQPDDYIPLGKSTGLSGFTDGTVFNNVKVAVMVMDLTQMFGAGNEPSTPVEFWTYFDNRSYPYNPGETQPLFKISRKSQWGSVVNKGDLINIEGKQYRVLKTNGNVAEVLAMYNPSTTNQSFGTSQLYDGSSADIYCNETFYSGLSSTLQNAIVEKTFTQDRWYRGSHGSAIKIYQGVSTVTDYDMSLMDEMVGEKLTRKCYVLSIQDIIDYLNVTTDMTSETTTLKAENIWKLFWNQTTTTGTGGFYYPWTRSASANDSTTVFDINSNNGGLDYDNSQNLYIIRPAFRIDLLKVSWTPASASSVTPAARTITVQETSFAPAVSKLCSLRKVRGSFSGTPTLYTTANDANKIEVGNNGYEWMSKVNDDNQIVSGNDFLNAFGVSQTVGGTSLVGKTLEFATFFSSRLSTTEGTDGGTLTSWGMSGEVEAIKDFGEGNVYCVVYDSKTDTVKVYDLDEYDERYGTFSVSAEIGYNTMIAFMIGITEDAV